MCFEKRQSPFTGRTIVASGLIFVESKRGLFWLDQSFIETAKNPNVLHDAYTPAAGRPTLTRFVMRYEQLIQNIQKTGSDRFQGATRIHVSIFVELWQSN